MISDRYDYDEYEQIVLNIAFGGLSVSFDETYQSIQKSYANEILPFDAAVSAMKVEAFLLWDDLACGENATMDTDFAVNDLLTTIADRNNKYDEDSDIYETIQVLDYEELREFLKGCQDISIL